MDDDVWRSVGLKFFDDGDDACVAGEEKWFGEADGGGADVWIAVADFLTEEAEVGGAEAVECPEGVEAGDRVAVIGG